MHPRAMSILGNNKRPRKISLAISTDEGESNLMRLFAATFGGINEMNISNLGGNGSSLRKRNESNFKLSFP